MHPASGAGKTALFVALIATALALGAALAHALELPNKIGLSREHYFIVQQIYAGWNKLALLLAVQFIGIVAVVILFRTERGVLLPAGLALLCLLVAQVVFWLFTFPSNQATSNWNVQPESWEVLRSRWEYSHLAGAAFQLTAMVSLVVAALNRTSRAD